MEAGEMELSSPSATRQQRTPWSLKCDRDRQGAQVLLEAPAPACPRVSVTAEEMKYSWPQLNMTLGISWFEQHPGCYLAPSLILISPISAEGLLTHSPKIILRWNDLGGQKHPKYVPVTAILPTASTGSWCLVWRISLQLPFNNRTINASLH